MRLLSFFSCSAGEGRKRLGPLTKNEINERRLLVGVNAARNRRRNEDGKSLSLPPTQAPGLRGHSPSRQGRLAHGGGIGADFAGPAPAMRDAPAAVSRPKADASAQRSGQVGAVKPAGSCATGLPRRPAATHRFLGRSRCARAVAIRQGAGR